jgi:hypothetical protein
MEVNIREIYMNVHDYRRLATTENYYWYRLLLITITELLLIQNITDYYYWTITDTEYYWLLLLIQNIIDYYYWTITDTEYYWLLLLDYYWYRLRAVSFAFGCKITSSFRVSQKAFPSFN